MDKKAGPVMTLCPQCGTIQKAGAPCPNCRFPIPVPKQKSEDEKKEGNRHLANAIHMLVREEADEEMKELRESGVSGDYCPVCEAWLPDNDPRWEGIVTERGTRDSPEVIEYICRKCLERLEEQKAERTLEDREWRSYS
jgi:hypothetical protein